MSKQTIRELLDDVRSDVDSTHEMAAAELAERVEAVLKLHEPRTYGDGQGCCFACHTMAPCTTVRALNGEPC